MSRPATDWDLAAKGSPGAEGGKPAVYPAAAEQHESSSPPPARASRPVRRSGSRLVPALMLFTAYVFAYWALETTFSEEAALPVGYRYMLILTGLPFLLAAHGFALVRWSQLRRLDEVQGTVRDVTTDVALSVWEIFFCWLGISASLVFLYYAAPVTDLKEWYPRFFLVLVVFFGATYQKALVFVFALLPFVVTLTGLALWASGVRGPLALGASLDLAVAAGLLLADLAVLSWAVKLTRRHGGFRVCEFQMPFGAGFVGGHLAGVVRTRQKSMPESGFQLHLSCVQQYKKGDKKRQGQVLWHAQKTVRGDLPGARHTDASIPVVFLLPAETPATSTRHEDNRVTWTLRATGALPETDFSCIFEVPVRRTEEPELLQPPMHLLHAQGSQPPDPKPISRPGPEGGTIFRFRNTWNRATELVTVAYLLFWLQLIWLATSYTIGWETWVMFGAGLWFLGWAMVPWTSATVVTINEGLVKIINHRLLTRTNTIVLPSDLKDVEVKPSSLRTGLTEGLDFYHLDLKQTTGKTVTAGRHLRDRQEAQGMARQMKDLIAQAR